jgi:uncharacterized protein YlbG (UPF0298 family)
MEVNIYNLFRDHNLVSDHKEYSELVWLRCMYVNEERIDTPTKTLKLDKKVKNIRAVYKKIII